jgi:glycerate kinase
VRIVIATDSFKGSLRSTEVAHHLASGLCATWPELAVQELPLSDGGEGLVESLVVAAGGEFVDVTVTGPLETPVQARFGLIDGGETAVIEMAAASGLPLVPEDQRNPLYTTTRGTGELMQAALERGVRKLVVGIGGSATNDGGAGMAQALGIQLLCADGSPIRSGAAGLEELARVDLSGRDSRLNNIELVVASDVDNPLCGPRGASAVYGPQKGATPADIPRLDAALAHYADLVEAAIGSPQGGESETTRYRDLPGAGAAGGLGFGLMALLQAQLRPGIEMVLETLHASERFAAADLVITGEGRMDLSTLHGKLAVGVARSARRAGARVIAVCGGLLVPADVVEDVGIEAVIPLVNRPMTVAEAMSDAAALTEATGRTIAAMLRLGRDLADK